MIAIGWKPLRQHRAGALIISACLLTATFGSATAIADQQTRDRPAAGPERAPETSGKSGSAKSEQRSPGRSGDAERDRAPQSGACPAWNTPDLELIV